MPGTRYRNSSAVISTDKVELAISLIERSKEIQDLEALLKRDTGRPRSLSVKAVFAALVLLALEDRPLILKLATEVIYFQFTQEQSQRLGVISSITDHGQFLALYRRVRYLFHLICDQVDPSPLAKNRCVESEILTAISKPIGESEALDRTESLLKLCNSLLEQSVKLLSEAELSNFNGSIGLDATLVPLFSRGPSKTKGTCASDPDGGWYVREGDHRDSEDHKGRQRSKVAWGLEATIATWPRCQTTELQTTELRNIPIWLLVSQSTGQGSIREEMG